MRFSRQSIFMRMRPRPDLAKKHGMLFDGLVSDKVGGYAWFADYYNVPMHVIRQNIDEKHGADTFLN